MKPQSDLFWGSFGAALLMCALICLPTLVTSCKTVGAPDPEVTQKTTTAVQALGVVHEVVEYDHQTAGSWLDVVDAEMLALLDREGDKALSVLDAKKAHRVLVGTKDMRAHLMTDVPYVRQRARSLSVLIATMGLYNQDPNLKERVRKIIGGFSDEAEDAEDGAGGTDSGDGSGSEAEGREGSAGDSGTD